MITFQGRNHSFALWLKTITVLDQRCITHFHATHDRQKPHLVEGASLGRGVPGLCSYLLPSSRWFPPKVSEGSIRTTWRVCPLQLGDGERDASEWGPVPSQRSLKLRGWKGRGAPRGANCKFSAGRAKMCQFSYGPRDPRE